MRVYILLDRSGSMGAQWTDTIGGLNAYVKGLEGLGGDTNVHIAAFDSGYNGDMSYSVVRNTTVAGFEEISPKEIEPRGGTPLLDAMGKLLDLAFAEKSEKAYVVVITDGEENMSRKFKKDVIAEKLARAEDRNWEVIFLGANFDQVTAQAASVGLNFNKAYSVASKNIGDEMTWLSNQTVAYAACGARTEFTAADRTRAKK